MDTSTIGSPEKLLSIFQGYPATCRREDRGPCGLVTRVKSVSSKSSLFEPFSQALPPGSNGTAGRGLGLALARAIAESRGWKLALENTADQQGAMFSVRLSAEVGTPE